MTGMALKHCILGKFLGVVCHCFPPNMEHIKKKTVFRQQGTFTYVFSTILTRNGRFTLRHSPVFLREALVWYKINLYTIQINFFFTRLVTNTVKPCSRTHAVVVENKTINLSVTSVALRTGKMAHL